jgi:hypothetical protein
MMLTGAEFPCDPIFAAVRHHRQAVARARVAIDATFALEAWCRDAAMEPGDVGVTNLERLQVDAEREADLAFMRLVAIKPVSRTGAYIFARHLARHYRRVYGRGDLGDPAEALATALETVLPYLAGTKGREAPARPR